MQSQILRKIINLNMNRNLLSKELSLKDTNALKGIALMLLLLHHLFYIDNGLFYDVHLYKDHYLINEIGIASKVCVSIFVMLSGYGLAVSAQKGINLKSFYCRRFTKLLIHYWFIWLIFVPISVFVFGRSFEDAYGNNIIIKFIFDIFGVINVFGLYGYNVTWWFYSAIIILYIIFPFLYKRIVSNPIEAVLIAIAFYYIPSPFARGAMLYLLSFTIGILYQHFTSYPPYGLSYVNRQQDDYGNYNDASFSR